MSNPGASTSSTFNSALSPNALQLLFILPMANMLLSSQDQQFTRVFTGSSYDPLYIIALWKSGAASGGPSGGIYPSPSRGGTGLVSSLQSYAGLTGANTQTNCTIQAATTTYSQTPYLNVNNPNTGALFAEFRIYGFCYDT